MSNSLLQRIFAPLRLNHLELPNRLVMGSMHLGLTGEDQYERMARFYALRSEGGPGLIVTGGCSPDAAGRSDVDGLSLDSDALISRHRAIVEAVHRAGTSKIALQLLHAGREGFHGSIVAPSALRLPGSLFTPKAMTEADILNTVEGYASAARRAVEAGYDAIELLFSQGFLVHQFMVSHSNRRADHWGAGLAGRTRFATLVAGSVREAVGPGYPLVFRLPCLDMLEGGLAFEESMQLVEKLEPFGIDLLNVSIGWHESKVPTLAFVAPPTAFAAAAWQVKARFPHLKVCASNRVADLRHAEALLLEGACDMVSLARPFLADRRIVAKSAAGRFEDVNPCIACNQDCLDHMFLGQHIGCSVNPECGTAEDGQAPPALPDGTRIAVVGGGVAGLSAAWHLRRRGADVTLFEKSTGLGGQMLLAGRIPSKSGFLGTVNHLVRNVRRSGVRVQLETEFTANELIPHLWDHVVIATGTSPADTDTRTDIDRAGAKAAGVTIVCGYELLRHDLPVAFPVIILGGGGVGCDIAKFLLNRPSRLDISEGYLRAQAAERWVGPLPTRQAPDRSITIVQRSSRKIGHRIGRTTRWITMAQLESAGVRMLRGTSLAGYERGKVRLRTPTGEERMAARTIVLATGQTPGFEGLRTALASADIPHTVIGAANTSQTPASISSSTSDGYRCAMGLVVRLGATPDQQERA